MGGGCWSYWWTVMVVGGRDQLKMFKIGGTISLTLPKLMEEGPVNPH